MNKISGLECLSLTQLLSEATRNNLRNCTFQNFPGGACPQTPPSIGVAMPHLRIIIFIILLCPWPDHSNFACYGPGYSIVRKVDKGHLVKAGPYQSSPSPEAIYTMTTINSQQAQVQHPLHSREVHSQS